MYRQELKNNCEEFHFVVSICIYLSYHYKNEAIFKLKTLFCPVLSLLRAKLTQVF